MISIQAGRVHAWAACPIPIDALDHVVASLRHLGTLPVPEDASGRRQGRSIWVGSHAGRPIGLSWRWGEVMPGVLALSDPMSIASNIGFIGRAGAPLGDGERVLYLNTLLHALDWQTSALRGNVQPDTPHPPLEPAGQLPAWA